MNDRVAQCRERSRESLSLLRLPFRSQTWQGGQGVWQGKGTGSAIDFRDHRVYVPGDDPRHINWQAYARTGHYSMKVFEEEVQPQIDIVLDCSASMGLTQEKADRTVELLYFCCEQAWEAGAILRLYHLKSGEVILQDPAELLAGSWQPEWQGDHEGDFHFSRLSFSPNGMRIFISDLLFEMDANPLLSSLTAVGGKGILFVPYLAEEVSPAWSGNLELVDCESGEKRKQRVTDALSQNYRRNYQNHFQWWKDRARQFGCHLARVGADGQLVTALRDDALAVGAVEMAV
ncbi:MAG: DUF58 domain-containing protein [Verrucomicrobiota bacterium]